MLNISDKIGRILGAGCLIFMLAGCSVKPPAVHAEEKAVFAAWLAYWDVENGEKDLQAFHKKLSKLSYFAASFDENDRLVVADAIADARKRLRKDDEGKEAYLTFVNDQRLADGTDLMKDTDVLLRVFNGAAKRERHAEEMVRLAKAGGYDGIEVDYERVWRAEGLDTLYLQFLDVLRKKAAQSGLKLRVVLEPETPFAKAAFPAGPEYVVMMYNLFGTHSGPGPKANPAFIAATIHKMRALPPQRSVAFSTGGCRWDSNGEKKFITEMQAKTLAKQYGAKETRDKESGCLVFRYEDNHVRHEVWYADEKTLRLWISTAKQAGITDISIWRLGGNQKLNRLK